MTQTETLQKPNTDKESLKRKALNVAAVGSAAVAAAVGVANMNNAPSIPQPNEVHKSYTVKPGDTAWGISERAIPNTDPRQLADEIIKEEHSSILVPGEKINLPDSSQIGTEVAGTARASSSG